MVRATIRTNAWDSVYSYLQTTNPISTNNIFSSFNSTLVRDKGYPIVIISPPNASFEKETVTGVTTRTEVSMMFEVYDDNAADCKTLADSITAKLLEGRKTFTTGRLMNMNIDGGDYDTWQEGMKKIHRITFNVSFRLISD